MAGLVRKPELDCELIGGGFRQFGGLDAFITSRHIDAVLDATHPFAATMNHTAVTVCDNLGLPCWCFRQPTWQRQRDD